MKRIYMIAISIIIALGCIVLIQPKVLAADSEGNFVVVLDPGHGGSDPGATNSRLGLKEADITYKIARYTMEELEKYEGVKVYLTRYADCPEISQRADIAKKYNADLVVSQHINSGASSARGAEIWVTQDKTKIEYYQKSKEVGECILRRLAALGIQNHGVSTRSGQPDEWYESGVVKDYYGIIRYAMNYGIRSILVEHAYISNDTDCRNFLSTDEQLRRLAQADAQGIVEAYQLEKKGQGRAAVKQISFKSSEVGLVITPNNPEPVTNISAIVSPSNAYNKEVDYYSSNDQIVKAWGDKLRALKEGEVTITAISRNNQRIAKYKVKVTKTKIPVQSINVEKGEYTISVDDAIDIPFTYTPSNATNAEFYWSSSNESILRVYGPRFRGLKAGTAEVIARTIDGSVEKRIKVTVNGSGAKVQSINVDKEEYTIKVDEAIDVPFTYTPSNAVNAQFYWSSSDSSILRVYENRFRGLKAGTAYVIAKTLDGTVEKRIKVTVNGGAGKVQSINVDKEEYTIKVDEAVDIPFTFTPSNATNAQFYWSSSNSSILRVYENRFRGLKPGTAYVIVKTLDGTVEKRIKVTIADNKVKVTEIKPEQEEYSIKVDEAVDIPFTYTPSNATNAQFYWSSSDSSILRVYENRFRGLKPGTAYVIVRTLDGTYEKRIKVTIE